MARIGRSVITEHWDHMQIPAHLLPAGNKCRNCGEETRMMINRGTGWCSEDCRKELAAAEYPEQPGESLRTATDRVVAASRAADEINEYLNRQGYLPEVEVGENPTSADGELDKHQKALNRYCAWARKGHY